MLPHPWEAVQLNDVVVDQMHQPWRTFAALINKSLSGKTTGLDKLRLSKAQIFWGMYHQKNVDYVELLGKISFTRLTTDPTKEREGVLLDSPKFHSYFLTQRQGRLRAKQDPNAQLKDDYSDNTLRLSLQRTQLKSIVAILLNLLDQPEMKEIKAYKTYLVSPEEPMRNSKRVKRPVKKSTKAPTRGVVAVVENLDCTLSKKKEKMTLEKHKGIDLLSEVALTEEAQYEEARTDEFKKPASPQLSAVLVSPEEPTKKSKRVKRHAKRSTTAPVGGVVIRETPEMPLSKKKEKMNIEKRKGIDLLFEVALTEEAQYEEARKKSLRDFHNTHPSGFGTIIKTAPSAAKIKPSVINEGTGVKPGVPDMTKEESSESEAES
ncbi:hypothetical protein Tco_0854424 [Tanacetum coccineum]